MLEKLKQVIASLAGKDKTKEYSQNLLAEVWIFAVSLEKNLATSGEIRNILCSNVVPGDLPQRNKSTGT